MTITCLMLETKLERWFRNKNNSEKAKAKILAPFSEEPGDGHIWSEQGIREQSRKIIYTVGTVHVLTEQGGTAPPLLTLEFAAAVVDFKLRDSGLLFPCTWTCCAGIYT